MANAPVPVTMSERAVMPADPAAPALLEFQSPVAALIARPVPVSSPVMIWVIAVSFVIATAASVLVPIKRVAVTAGKVSAATGNMMVQPLELSLVRSVGVKPGQIVHAGDLLAELDPTVTQADAGALEKQVVSLQAEVDRLTAESENRPYVSDGSPAGRLQALHYAQRQAERTGNVENFTQQIEGARVKLVQARSDVASFSERLKLAAEVEAKRRELERLQVGSQLNRLQATDTRMGIEAQLAAARSQVASSQAQIDSLTAQRAAYLQQFNADTSQSLTEQGRLLADAREQLSKASLRRQLVQLRAARDSIVLKVAPVSVGTVMQSGDPFLELVPLDAALQVSALLAGRDAGFVRVGDKVTIKFDTFPYPLFGTAAGTLQSVSPDSFKDPEAAPTKQLLSEEAYGTVRELLFRVRISIDEMQLHDLPAGSRVVPGMPVTAEIEVGTRTVMEFLMTRFMHPSSNRANAP